MNLSSCLFVLICPCVRLFLYVRMSKHKIRPKNWLRFCIWESLALTSLQTWYDGWVGCFLQWLWWKKKNPLWSSNDSSADESTEHFSRGHCLVTRTQVITQNGEQSVPLAPQKEKFFSTLCRHTCDTQTYTHHIKKEKKTFKWSIDVTGAQALCSVPPG